MVERYFRLKALGDFGEDFEEVLADAAGSTGEQNHFVIGIGLWITLKNFIKLLLVQRSDVRTLLFRIDFVLFYFLNVLSATKIINKLLNVLFRYRP